MAVWRHVGAGQGRRFGEELKKNARGRSRRRQESDTISLLTERGIVLALACLVCKHYINITLLSFAQVERSYSETARHRGEDKRRVGRR